MSKPSAAAADDDDTYRRRQKQMMESAIGLCVCLCVCSSQVAAPRSSRLLAAPPCRHLFLHNRFSSTSRIASPILSLTLLRAYKLHAPPFFFSAHAQEGHAKDASGSVETAGRAAGGVYRRRVKRIESAAERHTWDAATERDIARVHARLISHDASQREWYDDSSPLTKLSEAQEERQGNGLRDLQASSLSSPGAPVYDLLYLLVLIA
jgi:hypothetical protein